jgi:2-polyprenyl-3-methyl-5-hydroxy-6-metoxy-1,4-benzoquinol methylase
VSPIEGFRCDFCGGADADAVYAVPGSDRKAEIAVCTGCGLVQSVYHAPKPEGRRVSISSAAGWGNIRHGKGLRLKATIPVLTAQIPLETVSTVLDIGSNRGDFIHWLLGLRPHAAITAIEPDASVVATYRDLPQVGLAIARFEDVAPKIAHAREPFDLVHCAHTLEHAASASAMLGQIYRSLKPGGHLFLEVPNLAILSDPEISEEFFIDKHSFHFDRDLLVAFMTHLGFEILFVSPGDDISNITVVATRSDQKPKPTPFRPAHPSRPVETAALVRAYAETLRLNRETLKRIADRLNALMERQRVGFWGGGRIFDALVTFGGLRTDRIHVLVDAYIGRYVKEVHGIELSLPDALKAKLPQVLVVLAKSSTDDIIRQARSHGMTNVVTFSQLYQSL